MRANQNVTGLALTTFGVGVGNFFGGSLSKLSGGVGQISVATTASAFREKIPLLKDIPVIGDVLFSYGFLTYFSIALSIYLAWYINRTRRGLNLRAVGEMPATADAAGINVTSYKYLATCIGGAICGLGGLYFVMEYSGGTVDEQWLRRPRLAGDCAGYLRALEPAARDLGLDSVRRAVYSVPVHSGARPQYAGDFQDAAVYRDHRGAGADEPSQEEGGSAAGESGACVLPRGTINMKNSLPFAFSGSEFFCLNYRPSLRSVSTLIFAASNGVRSYHWSCSTTKQNAPASKPASTIDFTSWQP